MIIKSVMDGLFAPTAEPPEDSLGIRYHGPVLGGFMTLGERMRLDTLDHHRHAAEVVVELMRTGRW
jgi:hypothetical protein